MTPSFRRKPTMQRAWSEKFGWIYLTVSIAGWVVFLITMGLFIRVFMVVDRKSHSASDTLIGVVPYAALFLIIAGWVAPDTCRSALKEGRGGSPEWSFRPTFGDIGHRAAAP